MSLALGCGIVAIAASLALAAPILETTVAHNDTLFNDTNSVTKTVNRYPAKAIGYTFNTAEAATNSLVITLTRIKTLVDRDNGASPPVVLTWTNTHVIATILTTNTAGAIDTGTITDTLYTDKNDSITYTNTVVEDGILTIDWEY
jgi:hypothetical protein